MRYGKHRYALSPREEQDPRVDRDLTYAAKREAESKPRLRVWRAEK